MPVQKKGAATAAAKPKSKPSATVATEAEVKKPTKPAAKAKAVKAEAPKKPAAPKKAAAPKAVSRVSGGQTKVPKATEEQRRCYVEIAAYYIAERRGFASGDVLADWVQAEAEIDRLLQEGILKP